MTILEVKHLTKVYKTRSKSTANPALNGISFSVEKGEYVAVMGESGSGKTTLLNIIATLDKPSSGTVCIEGQDISQLKESELAAFRRNSLGFVFQHFNLLDTFSVKDNILLPLVLSEAPLSEMEAKLPVLAKQLGITHLLEKYPYEISGGEKQRTAIGRALITNPKIILADEPTGSLDSKSAGRILDNFQSINEQGQSILMVTHSVVAASRAGRVLFIKDGRLYSQLYKGSSTSGQFYQKITDTLTVLATGEPNEI